MTKQGASTATIERASLLRNRSTLESTSAHVRRHRPSRRGARGGGHVSGASPPAEDGHPARWRPPDGKSAAVKVRVLAATRLEGRADRDARSAQRCGAAGDTARRCRRTGSEQPRHDLVVRRRGPTGAALPLPRARALHGCSPPMRRSAHRARRIRGRHRRHGAFCIRPGSRSARRDKLRFPAAPFHEQAAEDAVRSRPSGGTFAFEPEPRVVSLDRPTYGRSSRHGAGAQERLARDAARRERTCSARPPSTQTASHASRCAPNGARPSRPGGHFRRRSKGIAFALAAFHAIERHARVELALDTSAGGVPDDGIPFVVRADSRRGDVPTGVVEVHRSNHPVGAARVQTRQTRWSSRASGPGAHRWRRAAFATWPTHRGGNPETPPRLTMTSAPSAWRRAPLFVLALALAAWMVRERFARRALACVARDRASRAGVDRTELQVVAPAKRERAIGSGRVIDAHDGHPLA